MAYRPSKRSSFVKSAGGAIVGDSMVVLVLGGLVPPLYKVGAYLHVYILHNITTRHPKRPSSDIVDCIDEHRASEQANKQNSSQPAG